MSSGDAAGSRHGRRRRDAAQRSRPTQLVQASLGRLCAGRTCARRSAVPPASPTAKSWSDRSLPSSYAAGLADGSSWQRPLWAAAACARGFGALGMAARRGGPGRGEPSKVSLIEASAVVVASRGRSRAGRAQQHAHSANLTRSIRRTAYHRCVLAGRARHGYTGSVGQNTTGGHAALARAREHQQRVGATTCVDEWKELWIGGGAS